MPNQPLDVAVKFWNDQVPDLFVTVHDQLAHQELPVAALRQLVVASLQLQGDLLPLLDICVFQSGLNDSDGVMLEHKVLDAASDDLEQFLDEFLPLFERDVRLAAQLLPELLRASDRVGVGLGGLALLLKRFLLRMGLTRRIAYGSIC